MSVPCGPPKHRLPCGLQCTCWPSYMGNRISLSHRQISQSHGPRRQGHTCTGWLRGSSGDRCGTHRELLGAATASLASPWKCVASLTNTEHPTQSTVTHTLPSACSECHPTARNLLFLPKGDSPPRQPLPKLSTPIVQSPQQP